MTTKPLVTLLVPVVKVVSHSVLDPSALVVWASAAVGACSPAVRITASTSIVATSNCRVSLMPRRDEAGRAEGTARGSGWGCSARGIHGMAARVVFALRRPIRFTRFEMFN